MSFGLSCDELLNLSWELQEILPRATVLENAYLGKVARDKRFISTKKYGKFEALINSYQTMPPSQLKRLKASLREQGIVGPQQSKKQKKQNAQSGANKEKRVQRTVALNGIREQFNPFEFKLPAKGPKFEVTTNKTIGGRVTKSVTRPGLAKARSEESVCLAPKILLSY